MAGLKQAGMGGTAPLNSGKSIIQATEDVLPLDIFKFTDPNEPRGSEEDIKLQMEEGWKFQVEDIEVDQLDANFGIEIGDSIIRSKDNALDIMNMGGAVNIVADEIELRVKAEGKDSNGNTYRDASIKMSSSDDGSEINIDADSITLGNKNDGTPETLNAVMEVVYEDSKDKVKINGDLEITSDDKSRFISAGSKGLYAEDASTPTPKVIHDLPDEPVTDGYDYLGHLLYFDTSIDTELYNSISTPNSGNYSFGDVTLTGFSGGNSNAKGGLFKVTIGSSGTATGAAPTGAYGEVTLRPKGTSWVGGVQGRAPAIRQQIGFSSSIVENMTTTGEIACPFGTSNQLEFETKSNPSSSVSVIVIQLGVYL